jgi:hypothetical protein
MNFIETEWISATTPPVREGVYRTRHRGTEGKLYAGFSLWCGGMWRGTRETIYSANHSLYHSAQQSKEWCGIVKEEK